MELIAGDIGGTKSWLVWVETHTDGTRLRYEKIYSSADFASGAVLLQRFVADAAQTVRPDSLTLALPGPLDAQRVTLTNLDWTLDAAELGAALAIPEVRFVNDFQAAAAGVATLSAADVSVLNVGTAAPRGVRAITGAGTGLGLAFMTPVDDGGWCNHATEGGHVDFAPTGPTQGRLLDMLRARHGHVSWERALSGSALDELYRFCCLERGQALPETTVDGAGLSARAAAGDAAAGAAIGLFVDLYGAWIGNVALLYQPFGGLYIAGGVAVHWADHMRGPRFLAAALDKGRMRGVVERTPIYLITCARLGVQGAVELARSRPTKHSIPILQ